MIVVEPLGSQYCLLFAWHELGTHSHLGVDTLPSQMLFMRCAYESQVEHLTIFPFPGLKIINIRGETILTFSECFNFMFQAMLCSHLTWSSSTILCVAFSQTTSSWSFLSGTRSLRLLAWEAFYLACTSYEQFGLMGVSSIQAVLGN